MTTSYGSIADSPRAQSINDTSQEHILPTVRVSATSRNVLTNAPLFHNTRSHGRGWVCRIAQCVAMLSVVVALVLVWARVQLYMGMASMNYRPECVATIANESATVAVQENLMTAEVVTMVTANPSVEYQSWMSDHYFQIQNRTLADLLLPGTHDSAGYRLLGGTLYNIDPLINILVRAATALHLPLEKMIVKWSQTQSVNIYQQLIGGVRYLDLRTVWDGRIWRIYHGVAGDPLTSILNSIISFQDNHRNEVLVIELAVYSGSHGGDVCALARLVKAKLGRFLLDGSHNLANTTIGSMMRSGKRIVFAMDRAEVCAMYPVFHDANRLITNTYADTPDVDAMVTFNHNRVRDFVGQALPHTHTPHQYRGGLYKVSWTLTPNFKSVVMSTIEPGKHPHSLYDIAVSANARLAEFVADVRAEFGAIHSLPGHFIPANILICDFWNLDSNLVATALAFNFPSLNNT